MANLDFSSNSILLLFLLVNACLYEYVSSLPILLNASRSDIKHEELLPPDHVAGAHMEKDGDVNKDYHHEAFLGTLIKEGKLVWENLAGYKLLIETFHKVDVNKDHRIVKEELENWIHDRILEHFEASKNNSLNIFIKMDHDKDGGMTWPEYKAQLLGLDPAKVENDNKTITADLSNSFGKEADNWMKADNNKDGKLDVNEFLAFQHPEHNFRTLVYMADEMIPHFDTNHDGKITLEEFTQLPPGEVDEADAEMDRQYQREKAEEFKRDMDMNNDNIVTKDEMIAYLDPRHKQHAMKEADYLIRVSDRDRDGRISEHEMLMKYEVFTGSSFSNYAHVLHDEF